MAYKKGMAFFNRPSYHKCPHCEGIWCDKDNFEPLVRRDDILGRPDSELKPTEANLKCPDCQASLVELHLNDDGKPVVLDYCENCSGVWFDADELDKTRELNTNNWIFLFVGIITVLAIEYISSLIFD